MDFLTRYKVIILLAVLIVVGGMALAMFIRPKATPVRCARGEGAACSPEASALFHDSSLPPQERASDLLSYMTVEEKIGQLALVEKNSVKPSDISRDGLGALLSGGGGKPDDNTPVGWQKMIADFQLTARQSRLGIPLLYGVDANHGHGNVPGATLFPHQIGLGAADDKDLVQRIATATAEELQATGVNWNFMPGLDAPLDIRWGRVYETFGTDVNQNANLGAAYVAGLQGSRDAPIILATAKHYVGAGSMQWGTSTNSRFLIDQGRTEPDEKKLQAEYLPPFVAAVQAGVGSVMVGLNRWGDPHVAASHELLTDVLKTQLGFQGFVVSDWYGVYEIPGGHYQATVTAINAGVDMVMLPYDFQLLRSDLTRAVNRNDISAERLDDAVRRVLTAKFSLGLFEAREAPSLAVVGSAEHRLLAREAVARSQVLLKNEGVLPIASSVKRIAVAGSAADNVGRQAGAWTVEWQGIDGNWLPGSTPILAGIREAAGPEREVLYNAEGRFETTVDLGIAVVGEKPYAEGQGDNEKPRLSSEDLETITRLKQTAKKVVVVLVTGRPLLLKDEMKSWDGLVVAWLPGSEGGGVADPLFGETSYEAQLPLDWPARVANLGRAESVPLFRRGFGLQTK